MKYDFSYNIYKSVFDSILAGDKKYEIRLLNDKSKNISIGDIGKFQVIDGNSFIKIKVTKKIIFENIDDLFSHRDIVLTSAKDYTKEKFKSAMYDIFGQDKVINSKIVAIGFEVLDIIK